MEFPCGTSNIEDELMAHEMTWVNPEDDVPLQELYSPQSTLDDTNLQIMSATDVQEYFVEDFDELRNNVLDDPENSPYIGNLEKLQSLAYNASEVIKMQIHQYTSDFQGSMALRKCFSNMIEKKLWYIILCNILPSQDHINAAKSIVMEFYNSVEAYLSESASIGLSLPDRDSLLRWQNQCRISYIGRPIEFIDVIQKMLNKERSIILNAQGLEQTSNQQQQQQQTPTTNMFVVNSGNGAQSPAAAQQQVIGTALILNEISLTDSMVMELRVEFEKIFKQYQRLQTLLRARVPDIDPGTFQQFQDPEQKAAWMKVYQEINTCREDKRTMMDKHFSDLIERLNMIINSVLTEIGRYRSSMALKMIGEERGDAPEIDRLQDCCKVLGQVVQNAMDHVDRLSKLEFSNSGEEATKSRKAMLIYQEMFKNLVKNCIVIDKHPCQVVMKEKKFIVELRHLLGTALPQTQFETTVSLIDSGTYKKLKQDEPVEMREVGKIKVKNSGGGNGRTRSTTNTDTGQVAIKFNNMSISIAARGGERTRTSETVAEEKLTMLFRSTIPVTFCNGESTSITCQTFSLPLVVTTHGKQEADANATIFWDNAFQIPNRIGFEVYESVPWENWLYYLDLFWRRHCESEPGYAVNMEGKGLDSSARQFITNTFFAGTQVQGAPPPVSWKQVSRNQLPKREFSFWTWFYKIVELVSSPYVKKFWKKGYVNGFISRQSCEALLVTRPFGTFMLRFSESKLGYLGITVFTRNQAGMGNVINLEPDNIHGFRHKRSLPGNMKDLRQLEVLYPDICKDDAFREYWEPENKSPDQLISPYVQKLCKVTIED